MAYEDTDEDECNSDDGDRAYDQMCDDCHESLWRNITAAIDSALKTDYYKTSKTRTAEHAIQIICEHLKLKPTGVNSLGTVEVKE